jgi:hypothetical protein
VRFIFTLHPIIGLLLERWSSSSSLWGQHGVKDAILR